MKLAGAQYNDHAYWERYLSHKDVWQSLFQPAGARYPLFIHTAVVDNRRGVLDANWAGYPDGYAVLGFLQYVFLPTAFHFCMHPQNTALYTPMLSTQEFADWVLESGAERLGEIRASLFELDALWNSGRTELIASLRSFCARFNARFSQGGVTLHVRLFRSTYEVARFIREAVWAEDVFLEDFRLTPQELDDWCRRFYHEPFARYSFLKFLNERVGLLA